jgi:hypothetical protein
MVILAHDRRRRTGVKYADTPVSLPPLPILLTLQALALRPHRHGVAGGQRGEEDDGRSSTCASPSAVLKRRWVSSKRANNDATATGGVKGYLDVDHQPRVCVAKGFGA